MISLILAWVAISVPAAVLLGRMLRNAELDLVPGWDETDERNFRQWKSQQDNVEH